MFTSSPVGHDWDRLLGRSLSVHASSIPATALHHPLTLDLTAAFQGQLVARRGAVSRPRPPRTCRVAPACSTPRAMLSPPRCVFSSVGGGVVSSVLSFDSLAFMNRQNSVVLPHLCHWLDRHHEQPHRASTDQGHDVDGEYLDLEWSAVWQNLHRDEIVCV